jgi:hypothetical protein
MATLAEARQKGQSSSAPSESRRSSKSSPSASQPESASSRDDGSGFQRGFLLSKKSTNVAKGSRGRSRAQKLTDQLPSKLSMTTRTVTATTTTTATATIAGTKPSVSSSSSAPALPLVGPATAASAAATGAVKQKESSGTKKAKQQTPLVERAVEKKDSGWAKGFLTNNNNKKKTTAIASAVEVKPSEGNNVRKSKARTPVAMPSKKKDLGWFKGFLTNNNNNIINKKKEKKIENETKRNLLDDTNYDSKIQRQRKEQTSPLGDYRKAAGRSDILLSINENDDDRFSRNAAHIIASANTSPKTTLTSTGNTKSLISVVFEESANETVKSQDPLQQPHQKSTVDCNERGSNGNVEGAMTMLTTKSLITPLISIVGEEEEDGEEKSSSIFIKEVSTTRKSNHGRSEQAELLGVSEEERCYSPYKGNSMSTENMKDEISYHKRISPTVSTNPSNKENKEEEHSGSTFRNDDGDNSNILKFQQELERLFSRPPKECGDRHDNDDLQTILMQFRTPEYRRYAWTYLLQQRQQQQLWQKRRIKNVREKNECDGRIRELFDAEYFQHRQQQHEISIDNYDNNDDVESSLESILRCVETEEDRRMSLQAVLIIQEYFSFRYIEQERHPQHTIPGSSRNSTVANAQAERIRRLMPLFFQLARLSTSNRRTRLVQTAWDTAILLFSFCIREFLRVPPSSSLLYTTLSVAFWEQLDLLLHHQLIWQQSKTTPNAVKINQLQEVRAKSKNILKYRNPQQERLNASLESLLALAIDLEKLIKL